MTQFLSAASAAALAWFIGKALDVPVWRDWDMGDRCDLAVLAFAAVWYGLASLRKPSLRVA